MSLRKHRRAKSSNSPNSGKSISTGRRSTKRLALPARADMQELEPRVLLSAALLADAFNYPVGNFNNAGLSLNGGATINSASFSDQLQLTDGAAAESRSAFTTQKFSASPFTSDFSFQIHSPGTEGLAMVFQGSSATALGSGNDGSTGIASSVAISFQTTPTSSTTSLSVNGVAGTPLNLAGLGINFQSGDVFDIQVEYDGSTLRVTETDDATITNATPISATQVYSNVPIAATAGGPAYVGFTAAQGAVGGPIDLLNWEYADAPATDSNIGAAASAGSSVYSAGGNYTITGQGTGVGIASDQIHFTSEPITGDTTMIAQVTKPTGSATVGLMLRGDATSTGAYAYVNLNSAGAQFLWRTSAGGNSSSSAEMPGIAATDWLKLVRNGPTVSGYISPTGANGTWTLVGTGPVLANANALMGAAVSSGNNTATFQGNLSAISLMPTAPVGVDTGGAGRTTGEQEQLWVNVINQSQGFYQVNSPTTPTTVDANGWPTTDFTIPGIMNALPDNNTGVYHISMIVNQDPTVVIPGATITNQAYNPATKTYTASVTLPQTGGIAMTVTNTGGGATNIEFIRPGYDPTNPPVFTTNYLNLLESLHPTILRFMNWSTTNDNPVQTWSQRTLPSAATQTGVLPLLNYNGTSTGEATSTGTSWEYAIMLANAVHADMWINIPAQANDNYIQQLALLIKNGDDVNGVSYPALSPDLNVYIEYSNETWNSQFNVYQYSMDAAVAEVVAGAQPGGTPSNLNYDNLPLTQNSDGTYVNAGTWQLRWTARRIVQISNIFGSVFGQSAINTRIRPVVSNLPNVTNQANELAFIAAAYGPPSNYVYAVATATYANMDGPGNTPNTLNGGNDNPNLTGNDVLENLSINGYALEGLYQSLGALARKYGLQMASYESGPDLSGEQGDGGSGGKAQAELDPRFSNFLEQYYQAWFSNGGGPIIYFTGGVRSWGNYNGDFQITDTNTDLTDPKEVGFRTTVDDPRPGVVPSAPTNLAINSTGTNQVTLSWTAAAGSQTEYRVDASTNSAFTANLVTEIAPASSGTINFTGLSPGVTYYFRVRAASAIGDSPNSNTVTTTTAGSLGIPPAPSNLAALVVSNSQVNLAWTDNSLIESGFYVDVATDAAITQNVRRQTTAADATSLSIYDLNGGTTYYFRVIAFNAAGSSTPAVCTPVTTPAAVPVADYEFNETSGTVALDSGQAPADNGNIGGGVTRVAGTGGTGGLQFDGSTGYVDLGYPSKLDLRGQITVSAWIKPNNVTAQEDIVTRDWDGTTTPFYLALLSNNSVEFGTYRFYYFGNPSVNAVGTTQTALNDGNWHLITGVYDGTQFKVYADGVLLGSTADPYGVTISDQPTEIGRNTNGFGGSHDYYSGAMDDVRIYNTGLSDSDVAGLFSAPQASPPAAPTGLSASNITGAQLTLNWQETSAVTGFLIERATNSSFTSAMIFNPPGIGTTYQDTTVQPGQTYYYEVAAIGTGGQSAFDLLGPVSTPVAAPAPPTSVAASNVTTSNVTLSWSESSPVTGYVIDRATNSSFTNPTVFAPTGTATTFNDTTVQPGQTYYYEVAAVGAGGQSAFTALSAVMTPVPPPTAPTSLAAPTVSASQVILTWAETSAVTGFAIERATNALFTNATIFTPTGNATTYTDNTVQPGQSYYYEVAAIGAGGQSPFATIGPITTPTPAPAAPTSVTATNITSSSVTLSWSESSAVTSYVIERSASASFTSPTISTPTGTATTYTDNTVAAGQTYYYEVAAVGTGGQSAFSASGAVTTPAPTTPSDVIVDDQFPNTVFTGNWWNGTFEPGYYGVDFANDGNQLKGGSSAKYIPALANAGNYNVYIWYPAAARNATNVPVDINTAAGVVTVTVNQQINGGGWYSLGIYSLNPATAYVTIRNTATNGLVVADAVRFSPTTATPPTAPAAPTSLTTSNVTASQVTLNWSESSTVTSYVIERSANSSFNNATIFTPTGTASTYTDTTVQQGQSYYYEVAAIGAGGQSAFTIIGPVTTPVGAPAAPTSVTTTSITNSSVTLSWSESSTVTSYVIERSASASFTSPTIFKPTGTATTYTDNTVAAGQTYYYEVAAIGTGGQSAFTASGAVTTPLPTTPADVIVDDQFPNTFFTGNWWNGTFEPGYYGVDFANDGNQLKGGSSAKYIPALANAGNYNVYIWYPAAARNATNVPVDINTAAGVVTVTVNQQINGGGWYSLGIYGLNPATAYVTIRNTATNGLVVADAVRFSPTTATPPTAPAAPTSLTTSNVTASQVTLNWSESSTVTSYVIERSTNSSFNNATIFTPTGTATTYTDTTVQQGQTYYYEVAAIGAGGQSAFTIIGPVTTPTLPPAAPTNFVAAPTSPTTLTLTWSEAATNLTGYTIQQSTDDATWIAAGSPAPSSSGFNITGLTAGAIYYFRIEATNSAGNSSFTTTGPITMPSATAATVEQDITSPLVNFTGNWWYGSFLPGYFGTQFVNDGNQDKGGSSVQFNPPLPVAGKYAVYVWYPAATHNASNVPVSIATSTGIVTVTINEQQNGGGWFLLGTYSFNAAGASVTFSNTGTNGLVVANAVQFVQTS
jgi:fibronectin type 3 domain-containing protein